MTNESKYFLRICLSFKVWQLFCFVSFLLPIYISRYLMSLFLFISRSHYISLSLTISHKQTFIPYLSLYFSRYISLFLSTNQNLYASPILSLPLSIFLFLPSHYFSRSPLLSLFNLFCRTLWGVNCGWEKDLPFLGISKTDWCVSGP